MQLLSLLRHCATLPVHALKSCARYRCYSFTLPSSWKALKRVLKEAGPHNTQRIPARLWRKSSGAFGQWGGAIRSNPEPKQCAFKGKKGSLFLFHDHHVNLLISFLIGPCLDDFKIVGRVFKRSYLWFQNQLEMVWFLNKKNLWKNGIAVYCKSILDVLPRKNKKKVSLLSQLFLPWHQ